MTIFQSGIDVSRYQGSINWTDVAGAGKQFALCRVGSSAGNGPYVDPYFLQNVRGAQAAGLRVGAYYYTYATTQAQVVSELETYLPALAGLKLEYPVFVDVEAQSLTGLDRATLTGLVQYAMNILDQRGWLPGWYSYTDFINTYLNAATLAAYPLWVADYRGFVGFSGSYDLWQYSGSGSVAGISGSVDTDYSYKNFLPQIMEDGLNGYTPDAPETQPLTDRFLEVTGTRTEYFNSANVNDLVGYLPQGAYLATAVTTQPVGGDTWVSFSWNGSTYWAALQQGSARLVEVCAVQTDETATA